MSNTNVNRRPWLCAVLAVGSLALASPASWAKAAPPKTVSDYLELLPEKYTGNTSWAGDGENPTVRDDANGYLKITGPKQSLTVALFRYHGQVTVGVSWESRSASTFNLLRLEADGSWTDVRRALIPAAYEPGSLYRLPRHGTTIQVFEARGPKREAGRKRYDLLWRGGKFDIRTKAAIAAVRG